MLVYASSTSIYFLPPPNYDISIFKLVFSSSLLFFLSPFLYFSYLLSVTFRNVNEIIFQDYRYLTSVYKITDTLPVSTLTNNMLSLTISYLRCSRYFRYSWTPSPAIVKTDCKARSHEGSLQILTAEGSSEMPWTFHIWKAVSHKSAVFLTFLFFVCPLLLHLP